MESGKCPKCGTMTKMCGCEKMKKYGAAVQTMKKSDIETCSCCSPMQQATVALMDSVFEKGKKSKPFHGYNKNRHSRKGGLSAKGRAHFKRKEGANLKPPVTTKPSKLKPGSKRAKRRKSFCARMSGAKGPTSKGGKLTPKGAALKRWNC
tara:strand:+ start:145 stop:594 length:450 start_codon:yes stop_codon:yes gene_type:complete